MDIIDPLEEGYLNSKRNNTLAALRIQEYKFVI
jgi:hypothetical protein